MKIHIKQHQSITHLLTESVSEYVIDFLIISLLKFTSLITIDDFGVSDTILLGDANSVETSMKCLDLACDDESPPLKNCKDLTMKLEVKYLFPTSCSGASFYIYQLPEGLAMRKILHMVLGCKRIHKPGRTFRILTDFHEVMRVQSPTCIPALKFHQWHRKKDIWKRFVEKYFSYDAICQFSAL